MSAIKIIQETPTDLDDSYFIALLRTNPEKLSACGLTFEQGTRLLLKEDDYTYVVPNTGIACIVRHRKNLLQLWLAQIPLHQLLSKLSSPYIDFLLLGAGKKDVQESLFGKRNLFTVDGMKIVLRMLISTLSMEHVKVILGWERVKESFWDQSATGIEIFSVCQNHDLLLYMVGENGLLRVEPARAIGKVFLDIHANYPHTLTTATIRSFLDALCFRHSNVDAPPPTLYADHFTHALSFLFHITIKSTLGVVKQAYSEWFQQRIENKQDVLAALHGISTTLDASIGISRKRSTHIEAAQVLMKHIFDLLVPHFNAGWEQRYGPDAPSDSQYSIIGLFKRYRLIRSYDESFASLIVEKLYLHPIQSEQQSEFDSTQTQAERIDVIGTIYSLLDKKVLEKYLGWGDCFFIFHKEDPFHLVVFRALVYAGHDMKTLLPFLKQSKHHPWLLQMLPIAFSAVGRDEEGYRAKANLFEPLINLVCQKVTTKEFCQIPFNTAQFLIYIEGRLKYLGIGILAQTKAEIAGLVQWQERLKNPEAAAEKFFAEPENLRPEASEGLATRALMIGAKSLKVSSTAAVSEPPISKQTSPEDVKIFMGHMAAPKIPGENITFTKGATDAVL